MDSLIDFDSASQLQAVLDALSEAVRSQAGNTATKELIEQHVLAALPDMVHQNISIRGLTWEEHLDRSAQATQPVDPSLLKATIQAQDDAFALSSVACVKRGAKTSRLAAQVDSRVSRTIQSGQDRSDILATQKARRESRRRCKTPEIPHKQEAMEDLKKVEDVLARASQTIRLQADKAGRAQEVVNQVSILANR